MSSPPPASDLVSDPEENNEVSSPSTPKEEDAASDNQFEVLGDDGEVAAPAIEVEDVGADEEAPRSLPEEVVKPSEPVPVFGESDLSHAVSDMNLAGGGLENETILAWREKQSTLLTEKDEEEERKREELREQAKKELEEWYKKYDAQLSKTKDGNRENEKTFVSEMNEITPGTEWERVNKLCDFNQKPIKDAKDTSRMKNILLQLKQNPKAVLQN